MRFFVIFFISSLLLTSYHAACSQPNPHLDLTLSIDYSAAEQTIELYKGKSIHVREISSLRGNVIAAHTAGFIATDAQSSLNSDLDSLVSGDRLTNDVYNLTSAKANVEEITALLAQLKKSNFGRRVVATVEQIFPGNA